MLGVLCNGLLTVYNLSVFTMSWISSCTHFKNSSLLAIHFSLARVHLALFFRPFGILSCILFGSLMSVTPVICSNHLKCTVLIALPEMILLPFLILQGISILPLWKSQLPSTQRSRIRSFAGRLGAYPKFGGIWVPIDF